MVLQPEIPNNWSNLSDSDIQSYIKYLQANIEGRVTVDADSRIMRVGNVTIRHGYITNNWKETLDSYTINERIIDSYDKNFEDSSKLFVSGVVMAKKTGRLAQTDEELQRLFNLREQNQLKIVCFADSVNNQGKQ